MDNQYEYRDHFGGYMDRNWQWLRPAPEFWYVSNHALHLRSLPGTLWGATNTARNICLRPGQRTTQGFTTEVSVTNSPILQGEQSGLIWYVDDDNYIKLIKENLENQVWIVLAREVCGKAILIDKIPFASEMARLRLSFADGIVTGAAMDSDSGYSVVGQCQPLPYETLKPGIYAHGGSLESEQWAKLTDYEIRLI